MYSLESLVLDQRRTSWLVFLLFSSLLRLILYWYCKEKFCLDHSWEFKAYTWDHLARFRYPTDLTVRIFIKKNTVHMNGWSRCKSKFFLKLCCNIKCGLNQGTSIFLIQQIVNQTQSVMRSCSLIFQVRVIVLKEIFVGGTAWCFSNVEVYQSQVRVSFSVESEKPCLWELIT